MPFLNFFEKVFVDFMDHVPGYLCDADPMLNHQVNEPLPIDEDKIPDFLRISSSLLGELRSCDEYTLPALPTGHAPDKFLELRFSHRGVPTFGLNIDDVQPEWILLDGAVDPLIARPTDDHLGHVLERPSVSHRHEKPNHQLFERTRRFLFETFQKIPGNTLLEVPVGLFGLFGGAQARGR